jgi:peptide/nickel transport system permease protein
MRMRRYVLRRVLQMVPTILIILVLNFFIIRLAPGDPARAMAGENASRENVEALRERWGLNKPVGEQLAIHFGRLARGDLGFSYNSLTPVLDLILERLPQTVFLMLTATTLSFVIGTLAGAFAGSRYPSRFDSAISTTSLVFYSMPIFWFGMLLLFVFAITLKWLPSAGMRDIIDPKTGLAYVLDVGRHAVLPVATLSAFNLPFFLRITRASLIGTLREDYITTADAVGVPRNRIFLRHALPNAMLPSITAFGLVLGFILTGAVMTETVFSWPGVGRLMWEAISNRDYPTMMGVFVFSSVAVVIASLLTDIAYAYLDPRVRLG